MTYARVQRLFETAARRVKRAKTAKTPLRRLRLLQSAEDAGNIAVAGVRSGIARLTGKVVGR